MRVRCKIRNGNHADDFVENVSFVRLVFLSLIAIAPVLTPGMTTMFTSIALPQMKLQLDEASWFGSITAVAWPFGSLFTGLIIDKYGRQLSLLSSTLPSIVGWFLLADSNASLTQLYVGRALTGFALGACLLPSPVYIAECITVNHVRIRSSISTWSTLFMAVGGLIVYGLSVYLPYDKIAFIAGLLSILSLLLVLIFIPESPAWLRRKGRTGDADVAQQRLGIKQSISRNRKVRFTSDDAPNNASTLVSHQNFSHYLLQIRRREVYRPLIITTAFLFFGEFSGLYCLQSYIIDVMSVGPSKIDPYVSATIGQVAQIFACLFLTLALPRGGMKILSITSFVGTAVGFLVLSLSEMLPPYADIVSYLPVMSIWATMISGQLGVFAIPYAVLGEMFPIEAKGFASFSLFADSLFNFVVLKIFPYMFAQYGSRVFFVFSGVCACGVIFVARCLPETVGKTVDEIGRDFERWTVEKTVVSR